MVADALAGELVLEVPHFFTIHFFLTAGSCHHSLALSWVMSQEWCCKAREEE